MKPHRIVILILAAVLGTLYYNRYHAMRNIMGELQSPRSSYGYSSGSTAHASNNTGYAASPIGADYGTYVSPFVSVDGYELMRAAAKGDRKEVQKLLESGVIVESHDDQYRTALMYASWNGYNDICAKLLSAGANIHAQDSHGNTAFDYAASHGLIDTVHFLLKQTHETDKAHDLEFAKLMQITISGDVSQLAENPGAVIAINHLTPDNQSPLHIAASTGSLPLAEVFLEHGAKVNLANSDQQTPLHWAAWNNQDKMIELLVKKGANISAQDLAGNTPLILAVQNNSAAAVKMLLGKGASKEQTNNKGETPLIIAEDKGYSELATLLK